MLNKTETIQLMKNVIRFVQEQNTFEALVSLKKLKRHGDQETLRDLARLDSYVRHLINII